MDIEEDEEEEEIFDEDLTRQEIVTRMKECLTTPGERRATYSLIDKKKQPDKNDPR